MGLYLRINFLIAISFAVFSFAVWICRRVNTTIGSRQLLRTAQILLLASLALPLCLSVLPGKSLPAIRFLPFEPVSEHAIAVASFQGENRKISGPATVKAGTPDAESETAALLSRFNNHREEFSTGFFWLWLFGVAFFAARLLRNTRRLHALLNEATLLRCFGHIKIATSERVSVPFSLRTLRNAWVIVPLALLGKPRDLKIVLQHELQHHRQGDTPWAILIEFLLCGLYLNPAFYLWKRRITEYQEFSCDEALIGRRRVSKRDYGSCLVRVAETALATREMYAGTTCMAAGCKNPIYFKSLLQRRFEMIVSQGKRRPLKWIGVAMGTLGLALLITTAYSAEQKSRKTASAVNPGTLVTNETIQKIAEKALGDAIRKQKASEGFAIVADPNTGKILAVANMDTQGKKKGDWALSQVMEPASLAKALVAARAIDQKLTEPHESHLCENGNYRYGDRVYHDWKAGGWRSLTTEETIANSSNICSIKIGEKLGATGLVQMLKDFGFGPEGTARSFPMARPGQLPPHDNPAQPRLVPYVSSGFGFYSTPLEMIQAYGAIANGGDLLMPQPASAADSDKQVVRRVLSADTARKMRAILQTAVTKGTAKGRGESPLYTTAGKTATSSSTTMADIDWMGGQRKSDIAQFIGFAPAEQPRVEVYVAIRDPNTDQTGAHGSHHAAPVFRQIAEEVLKEMKVAPDKPQG